MSNLPEAEREVNEIDVLEKLATIYAAPELEGWGDNMKERTALDLDFE